MNLQQKNQVVVWLLAGCVLVFLMVIIGGITRLTGSGLSITEWNLIMGTFPPINEIQWQEVFAKYQASPQFQKVNFEFDLHEFKSIFWWEYIHRFTGRLIGMVFLVPFGYFLYKKVFDKRQIRMSLFIFILGGIQGLLGWLMVKSGLVNNPHVSHFRLAAHLLTAFITFGFIFYFMLDLLFEHARPLVCPSQKTKQMIRLSTRLLIGLILIQLVFGAFVAGLHAGKIYTTFPKMEGYWMPESVTAMNSWLENCTENLAGVQFIHRSMAWLIALFGSSLAVYSYLKIKDKILRMALNLFLTALFLQFILGVFTLLYSVPVWLGVLHQSGAFLLFASALIFNHRAENHSSNSFS